MLWSAAPTRWPLYVLLAVAGALLGTVMDRLTDADYAPGCDYRYPECDRAVSDVAPSTGELVNLITVDVLAIGLFATGLNPTARYAVF